MNFNLSMSSEHPWSSHANSSSSKSSYLDEGHPYSVGQTRTLGVILDIALSLMPSIQMTPKMSPVVFKILYHLYTATSLHLHPHPPHLSYQNNLSSLATDTDIVSWTLLLCALHSPPTSMQEPKKHISLQLLLCLPSPVNPSMASNRC